MIFYWKENEDRPNEFTCTPEGIACRVTKAFGGNKDWSFVVQTLDT